MGELEKIDDKQLPAVAKKDLPKPLEKEETDMLTNLLVRGDLSKLNDQEKWLYYKNYCERLGLDPYTRPFKLIDFKGKITLYADATCADQLANKKNLTVDYIDERNEDGLLTMVVKVTKPGVERFVLSRGVLAIGGLGGESLANAFMKCETKAFRRGVLRYCGLGVIDEDDKAPAGVEIEIGEPKEAPKAKIPPAPKPSTAAGAKTTEKSTPAPAAAPAAQSAAPTQEQTSTDVAESQSGQALAESGNPENQTVDVEIEAESQVDQETGEVTVQQEPEQEAAASAPATGRRRGWSKPPKEAASE